MRLPGLQLVLDTNVLVHVLRNKVQGQRLESAYSLSVRTPRPILPIVVHGEIRALALRLGWGQAKMAQLTELLRRLPAADIAHEVVLDAYAQLDSSSVGLGRAMGKNDLWIAAIAKVQAAVILTTDKDFDHLHPHTVTVEYVDPASLVGPSP